MFENFGRYRIADGVTSASSWSETREKHREWHVIASHVAITATHSGYFYWWIASYGPAKMTDEAEGKGAAPPLKAHLESDRFVDDEEVAADVADSQSKSSAEAVDKGVSASHKVREYPLRETRISLPAFLNVCGESGHGFSEYFLPRKYPIFQVLTVIQAP